MVNITDEALVMQVAKFYFPRWDKGEEVLEGEGSEESNDADSTCIGSKHGGGAKKGETSTCSRTTRVFYDYCRKVITARESSFCAMWDERLKGEAIRQDKAEMDEEERRRQLEDGEKEINAGNVHKVFDADMMNGYWGGTYGMEDIQAATPV